MLDRGRRLAAGLLVLAVACTSGPDGNQKRPSPTEPPRGGTLHIAVPTGSVGEINLDPQRAYLSPSWELFRCCLLRTLYSYNGKSSEQGGNELRPDLAAGMPEHSSDGLTWTFHLRAGLSYGPPFADAPVVAGDIVRALEREARLPKNKGYGFYYSAIRGYSAYRKGTAD